MNNAKLNAEIEKLKREIRRLKPANTPGILTTNTTGGVHRKPINNSNNSDSSNQFNIPRWG